MANTGNLYAIRGDGDGAAQVSPAEIIPGKLVEAQGPAVVGLLQFNAADAPGGAYRAGPEAMSAPPEGDPVGEIITEARAALGIGDHKPDSLARGWG